MDRRRAVEVIFVQRHDEGTRVCMRGGHLRQTWVSAGVGAEEWDACRAKLVSISVRSLLDPVLAVLIHL